MNYARFGGKEGGSFVRSLNLHCTESLASDCTVVDGQTSVYAPPPPERRTHSWCASRPSPQIALVTSELERPYLPMAPSHLWLGGLNLYLLTETPTPSARPGWSSTFIPGGPSLTPATRKGLLPLGPLRPKGRVKTVDILSYSITPNRKEYAKRSKIMLS